MSRHLSREVDKLKRMILSLSAMVEENVWQAVKALEERDLALAEKVIAADAEIDQAEVDVEEECLKILALHQPVANDLRFIVSVLKINNDLERIGDKAVNIAKRAKYLAEQGVNGRSLDFHTMARRAQAMLKKSLDALVNFDADMARQVCAEDDEMDAMNRAMHEKLNELVKSEPENHAAMTHLMNVSRHLERIGDLATNIAEDVIYMVEGEIVRHKTDMFKE